jgi:hypothetical protein
MHIVLLCPLPDTRVDNVPTINRQPADKPNDTDPRRASAHRRAGVDSCRCSVFADRRCHGCLWVSPRSMETMPLSHTKSCRCRSERRLLHLKPRRGGSTLAQGNALGNGVQISPSPERAFQSQSAIAGCIGAPFQGLDSVCDANPGRCPCPMEPAIGLAEGETRCARHGPWIGGASPLWSELVATTS